MTYIVAEPCVECKYTDCAAVCPVEAFHELPDKLLSNPFFPWAILLAFVLAGENLRAKAKRVAEPGRKSDA